MPPPSAVPISKKACPPSRKITGTLANDSTLFTNVGCKYKPTSAKCGGLTRGRPFFLQLNLKVLSFPTNIGASTRNNRNIIIESFNS